MHSIRSLLCLSERFPKDQRKNSIFTSTPCNEYPDLSLLYGFINGGHGLRPRKFMAALFPDAQTHAVSYANNKVVKEKQIQVRYSLSKSGWGRIQPEGGLSLSLMPKSLRHSICKGRYFDCDMVNCHMKIDLSIIRQLNRLIEHPLPLANLESYCADPKGVRGLIAAHYKLEDQFNQATMEKNSALDQAKELCISLMYGGSTNGWKETFQVDKTIPEMPFVVGLRSELTALSTLVNEYNPEILNDLNVSKKDDAKWNRKDDDAKKRSVFSHFNMTWERIIQEECVASFLRQFHKVSVKNVVPSQDGFMIQCSDIQHEKLEDLFKSFYALIKEKYEMEIAWTEKQMTEAYEIIPSPYPKLHVTLDDLRRGEKRIADLLFPVLDGQIYYVENGTKKWWYHLNELNLWERQLKIPIHKILTILQAAIQAEIDQIKIKIGEIDPEDETKKNRLKSLKNDVKELLSQYGKTSKTLFTNALEACLRDLVKNNRFPELLDQTVGLLVFKDGILNLKTGAFTDGFKPDDYVTRTSNHCYRALKLEEEKDVYLWTQLKKVYNNNSVHLDYVLSCIGHAFTGDAAKEKALYFLVDGTEHKIGNNGKTIFFAILETLFPELVKKTDSRLLEEDNAAKQHKFLKTLDGYRVVVVAEGSDKKINAALLKELGDGTTIENEVMHGTSEKIRVSFKLFSCSNYVPKIKKEDEALYNRYRQIQMCSHFARPEDRQEEDYEELKFIADNHFMDKIIEEYSNEVISLIIKYACRYYQQGIPPIPDDFKIAAQNTKIQNDPFAKWFHAHYMAGEESVAIDHIIEYQNQDDCKPAPPKILARKALISEVKRIGIKYDKDLKNSRIWGRKMDGSEYLGGIRGWVKREEPIDDNNEE